MHIERGIIMWKRSVFGMSLVAVIVSAFVASAYAVSYKYEETYKRKVDLKGEKSLVIGNKRGNIKVVGEEGRTVIELVVTEYARAENEEEAKKIADEMDVEIERKGKELVITALYPEAQDVRKSIISVLLQRDSRARMDFMVLVPKNMLLSAKASSGDIVINDIDADAVISAASGDIDVERVGGDIEIGLSSGNIRVREITGSTNLNTSSGDITAEDIGGDVEVRTSSGDVELKEVGGDLMFITASGDLSVKGVGRVEYKGAGGDAKLYGVRGSVDAAAASGDLSFHLAPEGDFSYTVRTSSGEIELRFAKQMPGGFQLKANTTNGDISIDLPIKISKVGRHMISGVVRDGKSVVSLETVSGDITISEDEE